MNKHLGFQQISKHFLQEEAKKRGYTIETIHEAKNIFFIKHKDKHILFKGIDAGLTTRLGKYLSQDKLLTYTLLQRNNINIPECIVIHKKDKIALTTISKLGFPLVVKPLNGSLGRGVVVGIKNKTELLNAIDYNFGFDKNVIIQKFVEGKNLRVLVINHKVFACLERVRHHIVGDGTSTISTLLKKENLNPRRGKDILVSTLPKIIINEELEAFFKVQYGYTFDHCPKKNEQLFLKGNGYSSVIDVTDGLPQIIKEKCEQTSKLFNLKVTGIDVIYNESPTGDINYRILEVNSQPGIRTHHLPMAGKPRNVAGAILDLYFQ
ncbi:MAG TPA: ATP-grasp domain-containing protein [Candidatus Absconditabacterales bacterium]|nr:ATP-grasp domain-containing protein [Candidatus Absconditabacterales bacterium]